MQKLTKQINRFLKKTLGIRIIRTPDNKAGIKVVKLPKQRNRSEWPNNEPIGMVEEVSDKSIIGWVSAKPGNESIKVTLHINGNPVSETFAVVPTNLNTNTSVREFFIGMRAVWDYCKQTDRLTIRVGDQILPIKGHGVYVNPENDGEKSLDDLIVLLSKGYTLTRRGRVQKKKSLNKEWQDSVLDLQDRVSAEVKSVFDVDTFLIYGSLLGSVREGGIIDHDNDIDLAYISKHRSGRLAAQEITEIAKHLAETEEFDSRLMKYGIHIHDRANPKIRIDLFHLFFNEEDILSFPFGIAGSTRYTSQDWKGLKETEFLDIPVNIPIDPEPLLTYIYGDDWRTPIIGFDWNHARTASASDALTTEEERLAVKNLNARNSTQ